MFALEIVIPMHSGFRIGEKIFLPKTEGWTEQQADRMLDEVQKAESAAYRRNSEKIAGAVSDAKDAIGTIEELTKCA